MGKDASLVIWYGLSCDRLAMGGLPHPVHKFLGGISKQVFLTARSLSGDARGILKPLGTNLVLHGWEFSQEKYGLGVTESIEYLSSFESAMGMTQERFRVKLEWPGMIERSAAALHWPAGPCQWWAASFLSEEAD